MRKHRCWRCGWCSHKTCEAFALLKVCSKQRVSALCAAAWKPGEGSWMLSVQL